MKKAYCLLLFVVFRLRKEDLYLWILAGSGRSHGAERADDNRVAGSASVAAKKITVAVLKKILADDYYNTAKSDVQKVEAIIGQSILDIFDDNPVFAQFAHLRKLARNREFEIKFYGKIR